MQAWLATGTDLGGSLRIPASFCGVVGLRPSVGRVPQHFTGDPLAMGQLQLHAVSGPMARSVPDLALLLDAMAKQHPRSVILSNVADVSNVAGHCRLQISLPGQRLLVILCSHV